MNGTGTLWLLRPKIFTVFVVLFWVLATNSGDRSLILGTHMVEKENQLLQVVLWPLLVCYGMLTNSLCPPAHTK